MKNSRDLKVWEKAHASTLDSYRFTNAFSKARIVGSYQPNSACRRFDCGEHRSWFGSELEYHVLLARDLHSLDGVSCRR
jgi:hypothetical protein